MHEIHVDPETLITILGMAGVILLFLEAISLSMEGL
jgi:hypothetical protein